MLLRRGLPIRVIPVVDLTQIVLFPLGRQLECRASTNNTGVIWLAVRLIPDLEKGAERYVAEAAEMRKADAIRAKCYLGALKELQEAEVRAKQAELQRVHNELEAKIRAEYDVELLRLKEEHAQAHAAHEQAVAEREEKLFQLQSAQ
ncbi:hypothetical protein PR003_g18559 [Phytophthora rubi]|uniref:Uncharacterized protein n=1 Tax=Phytophthora rubi TaxID=129364 RepID=A0A6A4E581_9STRA|nr:hypothetical protein PR001_g7834 [Phytophthora rubi]KAE9317095.1 hypothetical protein PR003_g18559 [Phytophthora rubi]